MRFIRFAVLLFAVLLTALSAVGAGPEASGSDSDPEASRPTRVEIRLAVRGEIFAPAGEEAAAVREPIDLEARFEFSDLPVAGEGISRRRYRAASATVTVGEQRLRHALAADARDLLVTLEGTTPTPALEDGFLSRQEAELLDIPFEPLLIDAILAGEPRAVLDRWRVPGDIVAGLLAIDTVTGGGLDVVLAEVTGDTARLELKGTVHGGVDGVATRVSVTGTARVPCAAVAAALADQEGAAEIKLESEEDPEAPATPDRWLLTGRIERLEATLAERREAGWVAPGLEVEATIAVTRSAKDAVANAAADAVDQHSLAAPAEGRPEGKGRPGTVWHRHPHGRYTLALDRRWRVVEDGPEGLVMRLVDRGTLVAQCSIMPLPRSAPEAAPTAQQVSRDVERSLAGQFGHIAAAEATTRDDGTRLVRVVAEGSAEGRPFRWIHHVLTDPQGHRAAVTCMLEPALADRFGGADHELVAGVVLLPDPAPRPRPRTASRPGSPLAPEKASPAAAVP